MTELLSDIMQNSKLDEGEEAIEAVMTFMYFNQNCVVKDIAKALFLPMQSVSVIKNELKKCGLVNQDKVLNLTSKGRKFVDDDLKYKGLNLTLYNKIMNGNFVLEDDFKRELMIIEQIFKSRPSLDEASSKTKCTAETSFKKAILSLQNRTFIGKDILCLGDNDLVSISLGFLLRKLFASQSDDKIRITVLDIDERYLNYIRHIADLEKMPITCIKADLRESINQEYNGMFDCFYADPFYTIEGLKLFISQGIRCLKNKKGLLVFLSFAHKDLDFNLEMQKELLNMGLLVSRILPGFYNYEDINNVSDTGQMLVLNTVFNK